MNHHEFIQSLQNAVQVNALASALSGEHFGVYAKERYLRDLVEPKLLRSCR